MDHNWRPSGQAFRYLATLARREIYSGLASGLASLRRRLGTEVLGWVPLVKRKRRN